MVLFIFLNGLLLGFSLIMTLGPQNAFLIKQGARKNHAALSAIVCFICDVLLVIGSIAGLHELIMLNPTLQVWMIWFGTAFLLFYATKSLHSAFFKSRQEATEPPEPHNRLQIVLFAMGFSLLNPHAIIDTLFIIGGGSSQFPDNELPFLLGVLTASLLWFSTLTLTTYYFAEVLTRDKVWKGLEISSGVLMIYIGIKLAMGNL